MKRVVSAIIVLLTFWASVPSMSAQPSYGAQAYAQQQQQEERWKKLSAQMEEMLASQESLRQRIKTLEEENFRLSRKVTESGTSTVDAGELNKVIKALENQIREVDENRLKDYKRLSQELNNSIDKLRAIVEKQATSAKPARSGSSEFYEHVVQSGQNISAIAAAFRAQGVNVSSEDIMAANPGIDPRRIQVGQVIKVPKP